MNTLKGTYVPTRLDIQSSKVKGNVFFNHCSVNFWSILRNLWSNNDLFWNYWWSIEVSDTFLSMIYYCKLDFASTKIVTY